MAAHEHGNTHVFISIVNIRLFFLFFISGVLQIYHYSNGCVSNAYSRVNWRASAVYGIELTVRSKQQMTARILYDQESIKLMI